MQPCVWVGVWGVFCIHWFQRSSFCQRSKMGVAARSYPLVQYKVLSGGCCLPLCCGRHVDLTVWCSQINLLHYKIDIRGVAIFCRLTHQMNSQSCSKINDRPVQQHLRHFTSMYINRSLFTLQKKKTPYKNSAVLMYTLKLTGCQLGFTVEMVKMTVTATTSCVT